MLLTDARCGEETWEKAESSLARQCFDAALHKGGLSPAEIDAVLAGDLECQCTASSYMMRGVDVPYLGLYGACSTMAESVGLAACLVCGGAMHRALAMSSSHFCEAARRWTTAASARPPRSGR